LNEGRRETNGRRMETKSHHKTESALNECLLFKIEINKSTSINVITKKRSKNGEEKELKSLMAEKSFISITFFISKIKKNL
jgi:hypothetical protein